MTFDKERRPRLVIIGGRLEDDNEAIYAGMHRLAAGRIVIFPTASSEPEVVGAETVAVFQAHGFDAVLAPVYGEQAAQAACDPAIAELVRDYGSAPALLPHGFQQRQRGANALQIIFITIVADP